MVEALREPRPRRAVAGLDDGAVVADASCAGAARRLRLGWSVPQLRRDSAAQPARALPALAMLTWRALDPADGRRGADRATGDRRADGALAAGHPAAGRAVAAAGGELYVWTVDDAERIARSSASASPASSPTTRACSPRLRPDRAVGRRVARGVRAGGRTVPGRRALARPPDDLALPAPLEGDDAAQQHRARRGAKRKVRPD